MTDALQLHPGGVAGDNTRNGCEVEGVEMLQFHSGVSRGSHRGMDIILITQHPL